MRFLRGHQAVLTSVGGALPKPALALPAGRLRRPVASSRKIAWRYAAPIAAVHALALLALLPALFSWTGAVLFVVGVYFYGGVGINLCYHRMLTHRSLKCPGWLERCMVGVALCCLQDGPASWVAAHRLHHRDADEEDDPHTPLVSFYWSHVGWLLVRNPAIRGLSAYDRFARDILQTPFYMRLERTLLSIWIYLAHAAAYFGVGTAAALLLGESPRAALTFGLSLLVWGVFLRTVAVWHITWSVNSLTHLFGYRNYETGEHSRNNWLVAVLSNGEGWHNNHHADPASASNSHRWWEVDPIFWLVVMLERLGLATEVIRPRHLRRE